MLRIPLVVSAAEQRSDRCEAVAVPHTASVVPAAARPRLPPAPPRPGVGRRLVAAARPLPLLLALGLVALPGNPVVPAASAEPDLAQALTRALASKGLVAIPSEVFWVDQPAGFLGSRINHPRALVRAHAVDQPADIFLITSRLSPEGRLLELVGQHNISDTSAVDERKLTVAGERAAWVIGGGGKVYSVQFADLRGEPPVTGPEWSRWARWQNAITNRQNTGQPQGIGRRSFKLDPAASNVTLAFSDPALLIDADGRKIRVLTNGTGEIEGRTFVREQQHHKAKPGNTITWAVDRVRALPWFGSDRMQFVKAVAFEALDRLQLMLGSVTGDDGSERIAEEFGDLLDTAPVEYTDPETGWPPPPMQPMLDPPLEGEGQWRSLDNDPFVGKNPGLPGPFVTSFIRTDRKRAFSQIFVTLWDPRQVQLHAMSGTVEPKSATGETGPGLVPRRPEVMGRLLAGLNGGFQATHGEWGMMAEGVVYLPPKPYAATVAELRDGSTAFGTWPNDETVPDNIRSFRQNMTPLVMNGFINPYGRNWWGGVPPGWTDESRTVRSAICQTIEGFIAYLYATSIDADHLALAMQRARCSYAIHLDMNPGHTGLEFYRTGPEAELPLLARPLDQQWEAQGPIADMPEWRFRGRRMIRYMGLMNFPRYINRESRDFFYLTLRHLLPEKDLPAPLASKGDSEGKWRVKSLPQHGWPYALATTWLRPDPKRPETKVRVLKIDPKMVGVAEPEQANAKTVVTLRAPSGHGEDGASLWHDGQRFSISPKSPGKSAHRIATGIRLDDPRASKAVAALGVASSGMLVYAKVTTALQPGADHLLLNRLLETMDCDSRLLLDEPLEAALGGDRDLSGHPVARERASVRLVRTRGPGARWIFPATPIVPSSVWYRLQARRVRYFKKPKPAETEDDASTTPKADAEAAENSPSTQPPTAEARPQDAPEESL